ncbi:hypothetical protein Bbelb_375780 [Branchiostoma belcheri]|nr:hypothetical protein Bbelb_375780 [Branchiostoma belcheri]
MWQLKDLARHRLYLMQNIKVSTNLHALDQNKALSEPGDTGACKPAVSRCTADRKDTVNTGVLSDGEAEKWRPQLGMCRGLIKTDGLPRRELPWRRTPTRFRALFLSHKSCRYLILPSAGVAMATQTQFRALFLLHKACPLPDI